MLVVMDQKRKQHTIYILLVMPLMHSVKASVLWLMRLYAGGLAGVCVGCTNENTKNFFVMRLLENIKFTKRHD